MPAPKKKKKKKNNSHNKKQQHNQNNKSKNTQSKKTTSKQQENRIDYAGVIYTIEATDDIPYWGVLRHSLIYIYSDKNNLQTIPYDVIDVSLYYSVKLFTLPDRFAISFVKDDKSLNDRSENVAIDMAGLNFGFKNEVNHQKWYQILLKTMQYANIIKNNSPKQNNYENNIIHNGWCLFNNTLSFMELRINYKLFIYNNNKQNRKKIKTIQLKNYKNILVYDNENENVTVWKYGFMIKYDNNSNEEQKSDKICDLLFLFKYNNRRLAWMTHIDYCINNKSNYLNIVTDTKQNDINSKRYNESTKLLLFSLQTYDKIIQNDNQHISLDLNYRNILDHFHNIIIYDQTSIRNKSGQTHQCSFGDHDNKCKYIKRYRIHNENDCMQTENVLLCKLLDKIHCYFYHNTINKELMRDNISDKFVIDVKKDNDEKQMSEPDNVARFAFGYPFLYHKSGTNAINTYHKNETKTEHNNNETKTEHHNYIFPKYSCLKEELLLNPYYKLSIGKYYAVYQKAFQLLQTNVFKHMKAKSSLTMHNRMEIPPNETISINHIISLLIYCNETKMQKIFKQHTRKKNKNESDQSVLDRNSYIAFWSRYIAEACYFYGKSLKKEEYVYCGINTKLIFDSLCFYIFCPLSTTSELLIADNFATNKGIIMKLKHANIADRPCNYFDMTLLSDYINEKEKFFSGNTMFRLVDLIIDGQSHKDTVSALQLLQYILNGCLFYYEWNKDLYDDKIQDILIELLKHYISIELNNTQKISKYFYQLTAALIESFAKSNTNTDPLSQQRIFLNIPHMKYCKKSLTKYFSLTKPLLFALNIFKNSKISTINNILHVNFNEIKVVKLKKLITSERMKIGDLYMDKDKFEFYFQKTFDDNKYNFNVIWWLQCKNYMVVDVLLDMVFPEFQCQHLQTNKRLHKNSNFCGYSWVFPCSKIKNVNSLSIDIAVRVLATY